MEPIASNYSVRFPVLADSLFPLAPAHIVEPGDKNHDTVA